jgi:VCBS repeat-containing protein
MKKITKTFLLTLFAIHSSHLLFSNTYTLTNAGATGRHGPTQAQIDSNYSSTNLASAVTINTQGIQEWIVPEDGNYSIEVMGAQGGRGGADSPVVEGGLGAKIRGLFNLSQNEVLKIMVGQKGLGGGDGVGGGGGGGSFVVLNSTPLIVAGGGGGGSYNSTFEGGASSRLGGNGKADLSTSTAAGSTFNASGGAGFQSNSTAGSSSGVANSFMNGGTGATGKTNHDGGFGGGGGGSSSYPSGGGGGGYQGGDASGLIWSLPVAQSKGGYSFNSGTDQNNTSGANSGHGKVIITILTPHNSASSPPIITQGNSAISKSLNEDTTATWTANELNATDADTNASSLAWSLLTAPSHGTAIVDGNGSSPTTLSYQPNANFNGSDSFSVQVSDGENNDSITINLTVNSVNDNPTIYSINGQTLSNSLSTEIQVPENSSVSVDINASDPVEGDSLTFQKTGGTDRDMFDLNSSTGILSFPSPPDFENPTDADSNNTYEIWFRANDGNGGFDEKRLTIRVTNVIEDNDGDGIEDAYDPDDDNDGFSDATELAYGSNPLDANSTANASPTDLNASSLLQTPENQPIGTIVGQLTASDPDSKDTLTFTLVGDDNDNQHFAIETNGTLKTVTVFDFESNSSFTIRVKVRDQHNVWIKKDFTVQITNVIEDNDGDGIEDANDPDDDNDGFSDSAEIAYGSNPLDANSTANASPTQLIADSNLSILENSPTDTTIGTFSAQDIDTNTTLTYSLIEGNSPNQSQVFSLDSNGTLSSAIPFDYESNRTSYSISVRVADQFNASIQHTFAVYILNDPSDDPQPPIESNQTTEPVIDHNQTDSNQTTAPVIDQNQTDSNSTPAPIVDQNATPVTENNQTIVVQPNPVTPVNPDSNQTKTYWWTPLPETVEGWRTSPWFGSFRPFPNAWLYHTELGWMHATHGESGDLWLWNQEFGWLWTANGVFPHLFNHASANWIYFLIKQDGKAHYYDYSTESVK